MTNHKGHLSLEEGIKTPIYLIERPFEYVQETQGGFFYLEKHTSLFEWWSVQKKAYKFYY